MDIQISIIVPVYNLESLLQKCVNSILSQSFRNFELILVNDGSTDKSGELCDEYEKLDSRVCVIHKKNGGVASSRNAGLKVARGKYIGFVDNDDFINETMFEVLYKNAIAYNSDIVVCDFLEVEEVQYIDLKRFDCKYRIHHFNNIDALNKIYSSEFLTFICPWNKLYLRSLFDGVSYEVGNIHDDETVVHKLLYKSNNTTYVQAELYYYVQRRGSQMNSSFNLNRFGYVYALKDRMTFFRNKKLYDLHQKTVKQYMDKFLEYFYLARFNIKDSRLELKRLKRTFNHSLLDILKHKEINWQQKLGCILFIIHPALFEIVRDMRTKRREKRHSRI